MPHGIVFSVDFSYSLRVQSYPWAAQRAGGQTSRGSTDAAGSVYRVKKKNYLREFQKVEISISSQIKDQAWEVERGLERSAPSMFWD